MSLPCWFPSIPISVKGLFPVSCLYTNVMDRWTLNIGFAEILASAWRSRTYGHNMVGYRGRPWERVLCSLEPKHLKFSFLILVERIWDQTHGPRSVTIKAELKHPIFKKERKNLVLLSWGTRRGGAVRQKLTASIQRNAREFAVKSNGLKNCHLSSIWTRAPSERGQRSPEM